MSLSASVLSASVQTPTEAESDICAFAFTFPFAFVFSFAPPNLRDHAGSRPPVHELRSHLHAQDTWRCFAMEYTLKDLLHSTGISQDTAEVLEEEGVLSLTIFTTLREHFDKLLPKIKVGQQALLMKLWDRQCSWRSATEV